MKNRFSKRWWSAILAGLILIVLYKVVDNLPLLWRWGGKLLGILTPFIVGLMLAFLLYRPCAFLERHFQKCRFRAVRRPARVWAILLVYLGFAGLLSLLLTVVVPLFVEGVTGLINAMPEYYDQITRFLQQHSDGDQLWGVLNLSDVVKAVYDFLKEHLTITNLLGYVSGLISLTSSFISVLIAVILSVYMLSGRESLLATARRCADAFLPQRAARLTAHYSLKAADIFSRYVYSMLLDALCIGILVIPGMLISGIPYPFSFAVLVGVSNLIPYFGAITSGAVSVLVLLVSGHWGSAIFLGIYILVAQQIDGNIIQPRLYGQSVGIDPIYVLLAITVGSGLGGFLGMLLGVPVMAVVQVLVSDLITHLNARKQAQTNQEERTE